jgi:hypothetical protein
MPIALSLLHYHLALSMETGVDEFGMYSGVSVPPRSTRKRKAGGSDSIRSMGVRTHLSSYLCGHTTCRGRGTVTHQSESAHQTSHWTGPCRMVHTDFYEKALFVKPTWRLPCGGCNYSVPFARYASIRTLGELTLSLWWLGASWDPSLRATKEVLPSSERPSQRVGQVRRRSHLPRSEARSGKSRGHPPLFRVVATLPVLFTSSVFLSAPSPLWLSCLLPPLAPMGVMQRIVDLRGYPQPMQEHR